MSALPSETEQAIEALRSEAVEHCWRYIYDRIGKQLASWGEAGRAHCRADLNWHLDFFHRELARRTAEVERLTFTNSLTDLPNRRGFDRGLEYEIARSMRYGEALTLLIIDLDHFKRVNDHFGHSVGDDVLRAVAASLRAEARKIDTVARWGGEEFAVLLPATGTDSARLLAERMRHRVGKTPIPEGIAPITASVEVAGWLGPRRAQQGCSNGQMRRFIRPRTTAATGYAWRKRPRNGRRVRERTYTGQHALHRTLTVGFRPHTVI